MQQTDSPLARHLLGFGAMAAACKTMPELAELAINAAARVGMTAIASGMITGPRVARGEVFHFNNWPAAWLAVYEQDGFMDVDPLPRWAIVSGAPALWSEVMEQLAPGDPGHGVFAAAKRFGFGEGAVIPVRTLGGHLGLVSAGGPRSHLAQDEFHFLQFICTTSLHRAEAIDRQEAPRGAPSQSRRERECVSLLTQGMTEREIASTLGIREVTARFHLDNARVKTGARSRTHLAGIAQQWLGRAAVFDDKTPANARRLAKSLHR